MKRIKKRYYIITIIALCSLSTLFVVHASFTRVLPSNVDFVSDLIGGSGRELAPYATETSDGGFLLYSRTSSSATGDVTDNNPSTESSWIVKMDADYNIEWDTIVSNGYNTVVNDVIETSSGDYVGVGYRLLLGEEPDEYIFKLNSAGELQGEVTTLDPEEQRYNSIVETPSGFIIAGRDDKENLYTHSGLTITKIDFDGKKQKELFLDGNGSEEALELLKLKNGNYGVFANTSSTNGDFVTNHGGNDILYYEVNDNLNIVKSRLFGSSSEDRFSGAYVKDDGNILISGYGGKTDGDITVPIDISEQSAWLFEFNPSDLSIVNQQSLPTPFSDGGDVCVISNYILTLVRDASSPYLYVFDENLNYITKEKLNDSALIYVNMAKISDNSVAFTSALTAADGIFSGTSNGNSDVGYSVMSIKSSEITADPNQTNPINNPLTDDELKELFNVSAVDSSGNSIDVSDISVDSSKVQWDLSGDYSVTFSVTDGDGNVTSVDVILTIEESDVDTIIPVITADGEADIEAGISTVDYITLFNATAQDNIDGDITSLIVVDDSAVDLNTPGDYNVKFNVKDSSNNPADEVVVILHVTDTIAPVLTVDEEQTVNVGDTIGDYILTFNASAYDVVDGDITDSIVVDDSAVDLTTPGDYDVNFTITDSSSNTTQKTSILHVISDTKPTITALDEAQVGLNATSVDYKTLFNVNVVDGDGNDVTDDVIIDGSAVDLTTVGDYDVKFNYTRSDGIKADEVVSTLHVVDMAPTLVASPHEYVLRGETIDDYIDFFNVSATDDKDGDITSSVNVDSSAVDLSAVGDYDVIFSIEDSSGNTITTTSILTVQDPDLYMDKYAKNIAYACVDESCDSATDVVDIDSFESIIIEEQIIKIIDDGVEQQFNANIPSDEMHYLIDGSNISQDEITYQIDIINNGNKEIKDISIGNVLNLNQIEGIHDLDEVIIKEYNKNKVEVGHEKTITQMELYDSNNKVQWDYDLPAGNYLEFTINIKLSQKLEKYFTNDEVFSSVADVCFNSEGHYNDFDNNYMGNICLSDGADLNIDIDGGGVSFSDVNFTIQKFIIDKNPPFNSLSPGENMIMKINIINNNAAENDLKQTTLITDELADINIEYESALNNPLTISNKTVASIPAGDVLLSSGNNLYETEYDGTNAILQNLLPQSNGMWLNNMAKDRWNIFTNDDIQGGIYFSLEPNEKYEIEFETGAKGQFKNNNIFDVKKFWRYKY